MCGRRVDRCRRPDAGDRDRVQPADEGRDRAVARVRAGQPGHQPQVRLAAGERGQGQDHRVDRDPGRRVRRRDDQQLRGAAVGGQRLAGEPRAAYGGHSGLRRGRLHPEHPAVTVLSGPDVRGAVLRRILVPGLPEGPLREGRADHARAPDLAADRRLRRQARRQGERRRGDLPARQARLGRKLRAAHDRGEHLWRAMVRPEVERQAHHVGVHRGGEVLRRPGSRTRRSGRVQRRVLRVRHALHPGPGRNVVRRDGHGGHQRGPVEQQDRRQVGLRAGAGRQDAGQRLALHLGARHSQGGQGQGRRHGRQVLSGGAVMSTLSVPAPTAHSHAKVAEKRQLNTAARRRLPLLPALIFVIAVTQLPFLLTVFYSFQSWNLVRPGSRHFVGLQNYIDVFSDATFLVALLNTVVLTVVCVFVALLLGLGLAVLLDRKFLGRGVVRTLLITPFLILPAAGALLWKTTMFDPTYGLLHFVFGTDVDWLSKFPLGTVMAQIVWQWTPFMMLLVLAGLQSQSKDVLEAANVDGASRWRTFVSITLPHLSRFLQLATLLGAIYIVNSFDAIFLMTQRGPGTARTNLPYYTHPRAFQA